MSTDTVPERSLVDAEYRKTLADLNMIARHAAKVSHHDYTYDYDAVIGGLSTKLAHEIRSFNETGLIELLNMPKAWIQ